MSVKVNIYYPALQKTVNNQNTVQVEGKTVRECIGDLVRQYPEAGKLLFDQRDRLLRQVYVYINSESLNKVPLEESVSEKDFLIIAVLITGG